MPDKPTKQKSPRCGAASPLESSLERWCVNYAKARNLLFIKWVSPGQRGVPDRILMAPGKPPVFVELKTPRGRISKIQQFMVDKLRAFGYAVHIVRTREQFVGIVSKLLSR